MVGCSVVVGVYAVPMSLGRESEEEDAGWLASCFQTQVAEYAVQGDRLR